MGAPLTYKYTEAIFATRRKNAKIKAYKTDTHLSQEDDGSFLFSYVSFTWVQEGTEYKKTPVRTIPMVRIDHNNVVTLLMDEKGWPSVEHITIRNRMQDITGFNLFSDTGHHGRKDTAIRVTGRMYQNGWRMQDWCSNGSLPYAKGTQFQTIGLARNGGRVDCLNPPKDMKKIVKTSAVQQVKAETALIRKLAMAMLRVGFDEHINEKVDKYWYNGPKPKPVAEINYQEPTGDDALAVLAYGLQKANCPDSTYWKDGVYTERDRSEVVQTLRLRVLENGMKVLRQHIYETTGGYEKVEA